MNNPPTVPIFYDPARRRWRRFKRGSQLLLAVCSLVFTALLISIVVNPVLPSLGLPAARALPQVHHVAPPRPKTFVGHSERRFQKTKSKLKTYLASVRTKPSPPASPRAPVSQQTKLFGFYVNWDDTSFTSLKQNLASLDTLIPEWLHLASADGSITVDDPAKQAQVLSFIHEHRPDLPIVPLVNNFDSPHMRWEGDKLSAMLANPSARTNAINQLFGFVHDNGFAGISIDFENVPASAHSHLKTFMTALYARFHSAGLVVSQSVPLDDEAFDYRGLAACNDSLILMAYDEHWSNGKPGPISSQRWYARALQRRFAELPAQKYVIALGNYGYDWQTHAKEATEISFQEAVKTAQESEGNIMLDSRSLNPAFDYYDEHDVLHHVWFLNAVTLFNQLSAAQYHSPQGIALWRLGSEDPSVWSVFAHRSELGQAAADGLRTVRYGYDLDYEGTGEVLKVTAVPSVGTREITYDEVSRLITAEHVTAYASPYVISRWGDRQKKQIALTFDDGPDARYTPTILDILRQYQVPATFFVVGLNGELYPEVLRRIVEEGHEIGNHTFTHPNVASISPQQFRLEINATERLLESRLGLRSVLFRPPYAEDVEPENPEQVKPLLFTSEHGYYTIGMQIDPDDWQNPGVEQIVQRTIDGAVNGEGHVVLLHDSGGDRSQTVAALPRIIEGLRAQGFALVSISTLLDLPRDAVMPSLPADQRLSARVTDIGFHLISWASNTLSLLFFVGIILGVLRLLFIGFLAVAERWKHRQRKYGTDFSPTVSVIIPAYNEEKVITQTIQSLLASLYSSFDIVVVDDGSTDKTLQRVQQEFAGNTRVRAFTIANGGKAHALNYGITQTQADIVVTLDADTVFSPDTMSKLVRHFIDPQVGAVAGNAKVGNRINPLTHWQALEYITSQNLDRRAFALLNCVSVVPGAVGAWRRKAVIGARGFANETLAEDADLTLAVLRSGYRVAYDDEAVAFTEAPDTIRSFLKQRFRWMYGTLQAAWKHLDTVFRPRYGALGMFAIPNVLIFQIIFPLISPIMDLAMIGSLAGCLWQRYQHPVDYSTDTLQRVLFYYALFLLLDLLATVIAFMLERTENWRLLGWLFLQRFVYRQLIYYVAIQTILTAISGTLVGWGKLERKATVAVRVST